MYSTGPSSRNPIIYGVILGFLLIALATLVRSCGESSPTSLREQFVPGPTAVGDSSGIPIPAPVRSLAETAQAKFRGGEEVPAMTPVSKSGAMEVTISSIGQVSGGLRVQGVVKNTGSRPLTVPLAAFQFRDQSGTIYAAPGDVQATLSSGESVPLDLTLPIQRPDDLVMLVDLPDEGVKIEMVLLAGGATPTVPRG